MNKFIGLSVVCFAFLSGAYAEETKFSGQSWSVQMSQNGDEPIQVEAAQKKYDQTGVILHKHTRGTIGKDGIFRANPGEDNFPELSRPEHRSMMKDNKDRKEFMPPRRHPRFMHDPFFRDDFFGEPFMDRESDPFFDDDLESHGKDMAPPCGPHEFGHGPISKGFCEAPRPPREFSKSPFSLKDFFGMPKHQHEFGREPMMRDFENMPRHPGAHSFWEDNLKQKAEKRSKIWNPFRKKKKDPSMDKFYEKQMKKFEKFQKEQKEKFLKQMEEMRKYSAFHNESEE